MSKLKKNIIPLVLLAFVFGLYISTASPVATNYADSNELITASYTLGIPHPPGYPLYVLIGKLFSFIPVGTIAFRYAIMSSLFGALTVMLVYTTLTKVLSRNYTDPLPKLKNTKYLLYVVVPALTGALSLAFSYLFWLYSIVPEVFALSNFFAALIIYLGISWHFSVKSSKSEVKNKLRNKFEDLIGQKNYYPFLIGVASGLGFLAHQVVIFLAPALLYLIWITDKKLFVPTKRWLKVFGGIAVGLIPLVYFPLVSYLSNPIIDFGNVNSFQNFWDLLSRKLYATAEGKGNAYLPNALNLGGRLGDLPNYYSTLFDYLTWPVMFLGFLGLGYFAYMLAAGKLKNSKVFIGASYLGLGILFAMYTWLDAEKRANAGYNLLGVHERMYIIGTIAFALLVGIGSNIFLKGIKKSKILSVPIMAFLLLAVPMYSLQINYAKADKSDFYLGEDYAHNLFVNIEDNAIFFVRGDMPTFAAYYWQLVRGQRTDVTLIPLSLPTWKQKDILEQHPELWDVDSQKLELVIRDIISDNIDKRPIYFTGLPADEMALLGLAETPYVLSPRGPIQRVTKEFDPAPDTDWWANMRFRGSDEASDYHDWFAKEIIEQYLIGHFNSMSWYLRYGYNDLARAELNEMRRIDSGHNTTERGTYVFGQKGSEGRVERDPSRNELQLHREAVEYIRQNRPLGALGNYLYLVEQDPQNIDYKLSLAKIFAGLGWRPEAVETLNELLELDPEHKEAKGMLRQWELIE
ncbi:MAG: DUF2723 domain-containing protein [Candidatus Spechtbacterales bacterium]|nr:DUF2723 domain-containing protein [Candidatus Spechtbacterales bacterium]